MLAAQGSLQCKTGRGSAALPIRLAGENERTLLGSRVDLHFRPNQGLLTLVHRSVILTSLLTSLLRSNRSRITL